VPKDASYTDVIVPNVDSIRIQYLLNNLLMQKKHCLIVGQTGTGKSIIIQNELNNNFQNETHTFLGLSFSAQTSANQTQLIIDGGMEKRRKGIYAPSLGKQGIIFVDDLNMPQKEVYGAQPPIELLRQWMDYGGWYDIDTPERDFRATQNVCFAAAMGPPGGGRNSITNRYVRHFNVLYIEPYSDSSLNDIFCNVMEWLFRSNHKMPFSAGIEKLKEAVVGATIAVYNDVQKEFRPTPAKSHYTFNLRDLSKVFQGLSKTNARGCQSEDSFIKLWGHECLRVFQDRLINVPDRDKFRALMVDMMKVKFKKDWEKVVNVKPLLFGSFTPLIYPDNDTSKKPY
jgi:dynein heavy chain